MGGVFKLYDYCLKNVTLSGPTYFGPLLKETIIQTRNSFAADPNTYTILLILTDGAIHDMAASKDWIVEGSSLPLSIIVIGIGNADFSLMEELDSDDQVSWPNSGSHQQQRSSQERHRTVCSLQ